MTKYHGNNDPNSAVEEIEYSEMCQTLEYEKTVQKTNFKALFKTRSNRWRLGVVAATSSESPTSSLVALASLTTGVVFCQLSGNNIITYYLGSVLTSAGITNQKTQLGINIGLSVFNLATSATGAWLTDTVGRRRGFREFSKSRDSTENADSFPF